MASERAKELARKQRAEAKALKAAKRNSDNPADWGTLRQLRETYKLAAGHQSSTPWILLACVLGCTALGVVLGLWLGWLVMWIVIGVLGGLTLGLYVMQRIVKKAAFARVVDQPGGGEMALSMLDKKKWHCTPAVAIDRQMNCVHRAVGPGGLLLIGDGKGAHNLLHAEAKRYKQVLYGVEVQTIMIGDRNGQVRLQELTKYINKLPKTLSTEQVEEIAYRLKGLDRMHSRVPMPKGPLPTSGNMKVSRRAMRG